jgi:translation initiation factor 1
MAKDWKERLGVVYSTKKDFEYDKDEAQQTETIRAEKQNLKISLDKKQRKGKVVTLISNFVGNEDDLKELARMLKNKCGVGGSAKDGEIIIQGDVRQKVLELLQKEKYKARII